MSVSTIDWLNGVPAYGEESEGEEHQEVEGEEVADEEASLSEEVEAEEDEGEEELAEEEEVEEEEVVEQRPKSRAQERIQKLVAEKKEFQRQLDEIKSQQGRQGNQEFETYKQQVNQYFGQLQQQNQLLQQQLQQMQQGAPKKPDLELEEPVNKEFQKYFQVHAAPLQKELEQFRAWQKQLSEAQEKKAQQRAAERASMEAQRAAQEHVLASLAEDARTSVADATKDLTLAFSLAYGITPAEAAQHTKKLLEQYRQAANGSVKKVVADKVRKSKAAPPVARAGDKASLKENRVARVPYEKLRKAGYATGDAVDAIFDAYHDGYRKIK